METAFRSISLAISSPWHPASPYRLVAGGLPGHFRRRPSLRLRYSSSPDVNRRLDPGRETACVDVIGIGSRKDAVIDFCLGSSLASSSHRLRFWTIHARNFQKVQLLQRCHGTDIVIKDVEFPLSSDACPPAVILVASAGHGLDHIIAEEILNAVKSAGGLAAAILLKPFSFEGQRRQEEVHDMVTKLRECSHFNIVVEADSLLKTEVETLAEALESANNAVFLAMNIISVLMSEKHLKFFNLPDQQMREIKPWEVVKLLESYGEAKVGFGAGYNTKAAITQAVFHCPFLSGGIKDINGVVIFSLASACVLDESDLLSVIHTFRRITGYNREIIFCRTHEPDLEPTLVVSTLLIVGCNEKMVAPKQGFLSRLSMRFPLIFSLLRRDSPETNSRTLVDSPTHASVEVSTPSGLPGSGSTSNQDLVKLPPGSTNLYSQEMETEQLDKEPNFDNKSNAGSSGVSHGEEVPTSPREEPSSWNMGSGFHIAQLWAKERASLMVTNKIDKQDIFSIPVGVRSSEACVDCTSDLDHILPETSGDSSGELSCSSSHSSGDEFTDVCLDAVMDIYNSAWTILKGGNVDGSRKPGLLSVRAASMLEAERESQKSWTPMMEMQYKGGTYKGRCQGGLPEGKGHLIYMGGSFYDGMWRYGKRSGLGTFCYSNGDVFQGSWRDDLMHGKGWFYFHTGDRWFANFWKGKANGEGRFYSKNGSIFFGHFKNGWRHGQSICIDVDGSRWTEVWDEGLLVKRTELDSKAHS